MAGASENAIGTCLATDMRVAYYKHMPAGTVIERELNVELHCQTDNADIYGSSMLVSPRLHRSR